MSGGNSPIEAPADDLILRVRGLVDAFNRTDLVRLRISDEAENSVEIRRSARASVPHSDHASSNGVAGGEPIERRVIDVIKSGLVGIAHLGKPAPVLGLQVEGDRELGYVEALGIRNPVRSMGSGRLVNVLVGDGQAVEYGQPLFEIERA